MTETAQDRCRRYRRRILEISRQVPAAHVAPAFSCLEIVDVLHNEVMRDQDIFIMSKGHGCLAQYVVTEAVEGNRRGSIPTEELDRYCRPEGKLGAHPDYRPEFGIHASTGSLGHGLGIAVGQAYAERLKQSDARVYVLLSDGECQEGSTWEAVMVAANLRLDNLFVIVDHNDWGGMERLSDAFPALSPLENKFRAFGWGNVGTVADGHSAVELRASIDHVMTWPLSGPRGLAGPRALVCKTVKGKGVSYMEDGQPLWHYRSPDDEEYEQALKEIG